MRYLKVCAHAQLYSLIALICLSKVARVRHQGTYWTLQYHDVWGGSLSFNCCQVFNVGQLRRSRARQKAQQ